MELKNYVYPLLRWWWLVVLAVVLSGGASYFIVSQQPATYQASASLTVGQILDSPDPNPTQISLIQQLAAGYADRAQRPAVADAAKEALGLNRLPNYRVQLGETRLTLEITVTDTDPNRAAAVANAVAEALIAQSPTAETQQAENERRLFVEGELNAIQTQIDETRAELTSKQEEFGAAVSALEIQTLRQDVNALESKLATLQSSYADLSNSINTAGSVNTLEITFPATPDFRQVGPNIEITVVLAVLVGAILASGAAYLLSYLDDSVKTTDDVERATGLATMAAIAKIDRPEERLVAVNNPRSPTAEAFRGLRTAAQFATVDAPDASLLVTSPNPSEGKSTVSANLAVTLAQAGFRTILIDADLRRPAQHDVFELSNTFGLTNLLLELKLAQGNVRSALDQLMPDFVQDAAVENLQVLTSGPMPPNPAELLGSTLMGQLLDDLNRRYDYVVIDSAPTLAVTDAIILCRRVSGVIVVAHAGKTRQPHLKHVVSHLKSVEANVLGIVLNRISARRGNYYYYYRYRNSYFSDDGPESTNNHLNGIGDDADRSDRKKRKGRLRA